MAQIGNPVRTEPLNVPAPWEWPEPRKEEAPAPAVPQRTPEQVPTPV